DAQHDLVEILAALQRLFTDIVPRSPGRSEINAAPFQLLAFDDLVVIGFRRPTIEPFDTDQRLVFLGLQMDLAANADRGDGFFVLRQAEIFDAAGQVKPDAGFFERLVKRREDEVADPGVHFTEGSYIVGSDGV